MVPIGVARNLAAIASPVLCIQTKACPLTICIRVAHCTTLNSALLSTHSTIQNYLVWRLVVDRVSSLSRRFKDARANYRKVTPSPPKESIQP